uniref:Uncharacterized protein n=1 Tax=Rhizophora mucronata TaxID=61149 RepID=A0A2P2QE92_RHIMU
MALSKGKDKRLHSLVGLEWQLEIRTNSAPSVILIH